MCVLERERERESWLAVISKFMNGNALFFAANSAKRSWEANAYLRGAFRGQQARDTNECERSLTSCREITLEHTQTIKTYSHLFYFRIGIRAESVI